MSEAMKAKGETKAKAIAAYVRTSTTDQNTEGQEQEVRTWLDRNGIDPAAVEWYIDKATGTNEDRPALSRLKADLHAGKVRTVVVWKLDRLSRSMTDGMNMVAEWTRRGVRVVSVTQQVDVSGTMGMIVAAVLMGFAQMETEYRAERQRAGIEAAKRRGIYKGRKVGTTKADAERAVELRAKGLKLVEIATSLGTSPRTVLRYLKAASVGV